MFRPTSILVSVIAFGYAASFVLAVLQPWCSAHLCVPLKDRNYITIDNRSASWVFRIGNVGGVNEFEFALTETNPDVQSMGAKYVGFPLNWFVDWCFDIQPHSPYFLMVTPFYFTALAFGIWPVWRIIRHTRRRNNSVAGRVVEELVRVLCYNVAGMAHCRTKRCNSPGRQLRF